MYTTHTGRGQTQENKNAVHKNCHSRGILSGISTALNHQKGRDPRLQPSGMTPLFNTPLPRLTVVLSPQGGQKPACGFTLIELLVVILIIGLLAAVALPQYQKAVRKARMADIATTFNTISKAIDTFMLEDVIGYNPFFGTSARATLPIDIPCEEQGTSTCINNAGAWFASASQSFDGNKMTYTAGANASISREKGNSSLDVRISWDKPSYTAPWSLTNIETTDNKLRKLVCLWWIENYGQELMSGSVVKYHKCE